MRLFGLAFLTLYLELAIIRFASAEVLYLGYFSNYVLIAVFLGIGLGFLAAPKKVDLFGLLPHVLLFLLSFILITRLDVTMLRSANGQLYWGLNESSFALPLWMCLPLLFGVTALVFACIAQETGRCFRDYKPLTAYSIDILGSLAGIVAFTVHSRLHGTPAQWFAVAFLAMTALAWRKGRINAFLVGAGVVILLLASRPAHYTEWSPYQKIEVRPDGDGWMLHANGIGHQTMHRPGQKEAIYDFPYTEVRDLLGGKTYDRVLIIGAGTGTDTAYALHYGARTIDAVEIDPEIRRAGETFHPSKPYDSPKVIVKTGDGRAFMERATPGYDLIIYALPDSIALVSNYSSIRLESFLFTVESFAQARKLLAKDGVLVLYNYYRQRWLLEKLASMLTEVFGHPPVVHTYGTEKENLMSALAIGPTIAGPPREQHFAPATDDWPFFYMKAPALPAIYVWIMLMFVGSALVGLLLIGRSTLRGIRRSGPFLLMGAGFLLLETRSIIQFSLLFGATWIVNSLVFFAILVSVLVANRMVSTVRIERPIVPAAALIGSLVLNVMIPAHSLLAIESLPVRYFVASLIFFSPIFFANVLFGWMFKDTDEAETAFGWNVTGAMLGAALEYTSLVFGYQKLMIIAIVLYIGAVWWAYALRRKSRS